MRNLPRFAAAAGAAVLLSFSLAACGGDGADAPTDASKDDFCEIFNADGDADYDQVVDDLKDVGTPEDIDGEAREGFEILIDKSGDLEDVDTEADFEEALGEEDAAKVTTFLTEAITLCTDIPELEDLPTDVPTS